MTHKFIIGFSIIIVAIVAILPREYLILKEYSHGLFGHGIAFFFLSTMFYFFSGLKVWTQILYLLAIGLVIEIIQHFSDYRIASAEDLLFDIYGISSFYALLVFRPLFLAIKYRLIMSQKK